MVRLFRFVRHPAAGFHVGNEFLDGRRGRYRKEDAKESGKFCTDDECEYDQERRHADYFRHDKRIDEMKAQVPDWEFLSDREKNAERKLIVLERRQNLMMKTFSNISSETENLKKLETFIYNEPRLKGKEDDFIAFAEKPANNGATMEVLLNAFLFEVKDPEPTPVVTPPAEDIAPSLERGSPSGNMPPDNSNKKKEYTDEELKALRTGDPKKYNELIRKGLI
jgi:hypothetical protein